MEPGDTGRSCVSSVRRPYDEGMSGISNWPPLLFGLGLLVGALLAGALWFVAEIRRRGAEPATPAISVSTEQLLEAVPIPTVVFSDSLRPLFHNSAYEGNAPVVRRLIEKEWLQRTVLRVLMEGKGISRRSDPDNQQSVHIIPLSDSLVAVMIWDESEMYSADAMRQDFIANASHELNTPVAAILLLSEALQKSGGTNKTTARFVEALHSEAERLSQLTRDIGMLASAQDRASTAPPKPVRVGAIVDETIANHAVLAKAADIRVRRELGPDVETVRVAADPKMLEMAIGNILENAIQHSPNGEAVTVAVKRSVGSDVVRITVADQGPGIAPDQTEKVFQRFYRIDQSRERKSGGTGLGLSIARNVARGAGGDISVKSFPGQGSTFIFTLPIAAEPEGETE